MHLIVQEVLGDARLALFTNHSKVWATMLVSYRFYTFLNISSVFTGFLKTERTAEQQ